MKAGENRMNFFSRSRAAGLLALAFSLSLLAGCGAEPDGGAAVSAAGSAAVPVIVSGRRYFPQLERSDVPYSQMSCEHYAASRFAPYAAAVAAFASDGGEQEAFDAACRAAEDELRSIDTFCSLQSLKVSENPGNSAAADEEVYISGVSYDARDAYWSAMHQVAVSPHARLLDSGYADWQKEAFQKYDAGSTAGEELYSREEKLEKRYEALLSADRVDYGAVCDLYVELVKVRREIAAQEGYDSYASDAYESSYARKYTPEEAQQFWDAARTCFAPMIAKYAGAADDAAGATEDGELDCSPDALLDALEDTAGQMSPELRAPARYLRQYGLYDLSSGESRLDSGYTVFLSAYNEPFIFNTPTHSYLDYTSLFHEFGHFTNYFYCGSDLLFGTSDNDLSELQSQGMEVMFFPYYDRIFGVERGRAVRASVLMQLLYSVVDGAMYDEFQQRVYAEKDLTAQRVQDIFRQVYESYGYKTYDGYQEEWMDQIHNFEMPFYYISYGVSALSALELYDRQQDSPAAALDTYLTVAAMNTEEYYFTDALEAAGLSSPFSTADCRAVAQAVEESGGLTP